jgi:hypothetical protein
MIITFLDPILDVDGDLRLNLVLYPPRSQWHPHSHSLQKKDFISSVYICEQVYDVCVSQTHRIMLSIKQLTPHHKD